MTAAGSSSAARKQCGKWTPNSLFFLLKILWVCSKIHKAMVRIKQFFVLARLTAVEAARQPICLLLAGSCVILMAITSLVLMHNLDGGSRLIRDSGLAFHFLFGLFISGYAACSSLSKETRSGTAATVLSKPVSRELFFLAKYAGIAVVVLLFSSCAAVATLMSERVADKLYTTPELTGWYRDVRTGLLLLFSPLAAFGLAGIINFKMRRPFVSTAFGFMLLCILFSFLVAGLYDVSGKFRPYNLFVKWDILPASIMITMALLVIAAIALALSTRFTTVPTLAVCGVIFVLGLVSDYYFGRSAPSSSVHALFYALLPNWQNFWPVEMLNSGFGLSFSYIARTGLYAVFYTAGVLTLGMLSFRHTEVT